jgi:hypothetical protein
MHRVIKLTSFLVFIFVTGLFQLSCYFTSSLVLCACHKLIFTKWKIHILQLPRIKEQCETIEYGCGSLYISSLEIIEVIFTTSELQDIKVKESFFILNALCIIQK